MCTYVHVCACVCVSLERWGSSGWGHWPWKKERERGSWQGTVVRIPMWWNVVRWPCSKKHQADWFMRSEVAQLCTTLWDPIDCSLPDSSIHKILQARVLDWIAIYFSRGSSRPGIELRSPAHITDRCFTLWANRKACLIPWILKYFTKAFLELRVKNQVS